MKVEVIIGRWVSKPRIDDNGKIIDDSYCIEIIDSNNGKFSIMEGEEIKEVLAQGSLNYSYSEKNCSFTISFGNMHETRMITGINTWVGMPSTAAILLSSSDLDTKVFFQKK